MVNLNELRRGNYVKDAIYIMRKIIKVSEVTPDHILHEGDESEEPFADDEIDGIPLTPEILEKCGFEVSGSKVHAVLYFDYNNKKTAMILADEFRNGVYVYENVAIRIPIKYLHQLQNLFFALTGTELQINLTE